MIVKFVVEYVPQARILEMEKQHKFQMEEEGLTSIWDIEDMAGHEELFEFETKEEAENKARELLPLDHFGQVGIYREVYDDDALEWQAVEQAFHTGEGGPIEWEKC